MPKVKCEVCDTEFEKPLSRIIRSKHQYCSVSCKAKGQTTKIQVSCENCGKNFYRKISDVNEINNFCSKSCSAKYNNHERRNIVLCLNCGLEVKRGWERQYCCNKCQKDYEYKQYIERWKNGEEDGIKEPYGTSNHIRRYIIERQGGKCLICGLSHWMGEPIPLELDHIDGNYMNNHPDNLRAACLNCAGLFGTYKGRNMGNGRFKRRQRYKEGKSS